MTYSHMWSFQVSEEAAEEFERHYGRGGTWTQLFALAPGYIESLLLKDRGVPGRYLTIDRWQTEADYREFRTLYAEQYDALDERCDGLTGEETPLGRFDEVIGGGTG